MFQSGSPYGRDGGGGGGGGGMVERKRRCLVHGSIWPQQLTAQLIERNPPCDQRGGPREMEGGGGACLLWLGSWNRATGSE